MSAAIDMEDSQYNGDELVGLANTHSDPFVRSARLAAAHTEAKQPCDCTEGPLKVAFWDLDCGLQGVFLVREIVSHGGIQFCLDDEIFSPNMIESFKNGSYEAGELTFLPHAIKAGDRIIEIGSAIGALGIAAAKIVGSTNYVGYEANPELIPVAKTNYELNGLSLSVKNAVLQNRSLYKENSTVPFYINRDFWFSSMNPNAEAIRTINVPILCFEDEIKKFGANTLIIDIEGGEAELLQNADLSEIDKIFMEIHYWPDRLSISRMMRRLFLEGWMIDFTTSQTMLVTLHRGLMPPERT